MKMKKITCLIVTIIITYSSSSRRAAWQHVTRRKSVGDFRLGEIGGRFRGGSDFRKKPTGGGPLIDVLFGCTFGFFFAQMVVFSDIKKTEIMEKGILFTPNFSKIRQ
jgi:hypothetical protein